MSEIDWKKRAASIIKAELVKKDIGYEELAARLSEIGVSETAGNIATKLNRGTFSFIFVLQIFEVIGLKNLRLKD